MAELTHIDLVNLHFAKGEGGLLIACRDGANYGVKIAKLSDIHPDYLKLIISAPYLYAALTNVNHIVESINDRAERERLPWLQGSCRFALDLMPTALLAAVHGVDDVNKWITNSEKRA